jgi:hypothetical protein
MPGLAAAAFAKLGLPAAGISVAALRLAAVREAIRTPSAASLSIAARLMRPRR